MRRFFLRKISSLVMLVVMMLLMAAPACADTWTDYHQHVAPYAYTSSNPQIKNYTRGQFEDFYINYNGYDLGTSGAYHVGSQYPTDVWDQVVGENRYGYAAVTSSEFGGASGNVQNFLTGFQFMTDTDPNNQPAVDYLCDYDYLSNVAPPAPINLNGQELVSNPTFLSSSNINDYSVPIAVTPTGQTYYGPSAPNGEGDNNVACVSNAAAANGFVGEGWFPATLPDSSGNYTWKQATVSTASGYGPGPVALTQNQANYYMHNSIGSNLSSDSAAYPTQYYPSVTWHGQCGVSCPYNIFVDNVANTVNGSTTTATWQVVNQTPLYLQGINVRVYTKGLNDGKWTLQKEYDGLDMPPVYRDTSSGALDGTLTRSPASSNPFTVTGSGMWTIMNGSSTFATPGEPYITVVTANINLNLTNPSAPIVLLENSGTMTGEYWTRNYTPGVQGQEPPGMPPGDTVDWPAFANSAQAVLCSHLAPGYNDNVAASNQTAGYIPPGGGGSGGGSSGGYNLTANSLTQSSSNSLAFTFTGNMPESGTATVHFYIQNISGYLSEYWSGSGPQTVHIAANSGATVTTTAVPFGPSSVVFASVDANSKDGTTWTGSRFPGDDGSSYSETTYLDNYTATVIPGNTPSPTPPSSDEVHPTTYPIPDKVITYKTIQVPVMGWKKVPYKPQPFTGHVRARLIPPPPGWNEYGNQTGQ